MLVEMYDRWLDEVWSQGLYDVDEELLQADPGPRPPADP